MALIFQKAFNYFLSKLTVSISKAACYENTENARSLNPSNFDTVCLIRAGGKKSGADGYGGMALSDPRGPAYCKW